MMMKNKYKLLSLLLIIILIGSVNGFSQEYLSNLKTNDELIKFNRNFKNAYNTKSIPSYILLPFFDDFSGSSIIPNQKLWSDIFAYINTGQSVMPLNTGVATLDIIDSTGAVYSHANNLNFIADYLTSREIDLEYSSSDNIFLSFFYQPKGIMDTPEPEDSLVLEFYTPSEGKWIHQWSTKGDSLHNFKPVIKQIDDPKYLLKGFRFRFKNYGSILFTNDPSFSANADHWHIDNVYINKNRWVSDTIPADVGFTNNISLSLNNYSSMPWTHFLSNSNAEMNKLFELNYQNNSGDPVNLSMKLDINDIRKNAIVYNRDLGTDNLQAYENKTQLKSFNYTWESEDPDSVQYEVKAYFTNNPDNYPENDTCRGVQTFYNYYSYDDGNPENGYGLAGDGTRNSLLAYKFFNYSPADTLRAFQMYFLQSFDNASMKYFNLVIWDDNNGKPGNIIYFQDGDLPIYDGINEFHTYLLDTALVVPEDYYIGWQQTTADLLNIGFDKSRDMSSNIFYNINGQWINSSFQGALMMRPVFSEYGLKQGIIDIKEESRNLLFKIYPNPVNNILSIVYPNYISNKEIFITIYDSSGRLIFKTDKLVNEINTSIFRSGLYYLRFVFPDGYSDTKKIIINH